MFSRTGTRSDSGIGRPKLHTFRPMPPSTVSVRRWKSALSGRAADRPAITLMSLTATSGE